MSAPKCPKCGRRLAANRDEYEWYCPTRRKVYDGDGYVGSTPHYYQGMSRAPYNDMKAAAVEFAGDEEAFVLTWMDDPYVRDMARRAYRRIKA